MRKLIPFLTFVLLLTGIQQAQAQVKITWRSLGDVTFEDKLDKDLGAYIWVPTFGDKLKALNGVEVYLTGYVIPLDVTEGYYVLSAFPYSNCFFCGGAGPESVVELQLAKDHRRFKVDERLTFKGILRLNADDVLHLNYILEDADLFDIN